MCFSGQGWRPYTLQWRCIAEEAAGEPYAVRQLFVPQWVNAGVDESLSVPREYGTGRWVVVLVYLVGLACGREPTAFHYNVVMIDKKYGTAEIFDPAGAAYANDDRWFQWPAMLQSIRDWLTPKGIGSLSAPICAMGGPQRLARVATEGSSAAEFEEARARVGTYCPPSGWCQTWIWWWVDLRLSNPDVGGDYLLCEGLRAIQHSKFRRPYGNPNPWSAFVDAYARTLSQRLIYLIDRQWDVSEEDIDWLPDIVRGRTKGQTGNELLTWIAGRGDEIAHYIDMTQRFRTTFAVVREKDGSLRPAVGVVTKECFVAPQTSEDVVLDKNTWDEFAAECFIKLYKPTSVTTYDLQWARKGLAVPTGLLLPEGLERIIANTVTALAWPPRL